MFQSTPKGNFFSTKSFFNLLVFQFQFRFSCNDKKTRERCYLKSYENYFSSISELPQFFRCRCFSKIPPRHSEIIDLGFEELSLVPTLEQAPKNQVLTWQFGGYISRRDSRLALIKQNAKKCQLHCCKCILARELWSCIGRFAAFLKKFRFLSKPDKNSNFKREQITLSCYLIPMF